MKLMREATSLLFFSLLATFTTPPVIVNATTISTYAFSRDYPTTGVDAKTANSGSIVSFSQNSIYSGLAMVRSAASTNGKLAVQSYGGSYDIAGSSAIASWSDLIVNSTSKSVASTMEFDVSSGKLYIGGLESVWEELISSYSLVIMLNGANVWNSSASLTGGYDYDPLTETFFTVSKLSKTGFDPGGSLFSYGTNGVYEFTGYHISLDLGVLNPGESFDLSYMLSINTSYCDRSEAIAMLGDPLELDLLPGIYGTVTTHSVVPELSTCILLIFGLVVIKLFKYTSVLK